MTWHWDNVGNNIMLGTSVDIRITGLEHASDRHTLVIVMTILIKTTLFVSILCMARSISRNAFGK